MCGNARVDEIDRREADGIGKRQKDLTRHVLDGVPTPGDWVEEALELHLRDGRVSHEAMALFLSMSPWTALRRLRTQLATMAPPDLQQQFEQQIERFVKVKAYEQIEPLVSEDEYREQCCRAVRRFQWSRKLARVWLWEVGLIDYRLSTEFLFGAIRESSHQTPEMFQDVATLKCRPEGLVVVQAQFGLKYQGESAEWCKPNLDCFEQGLTLREGLTFQLYEHRGRDFDRCKMDLIGSELKPGWERSYPNHHTPYLGFHGIGIHASDQLDLCRGAATRGILS